jgi:hypothetical protein
MLRSLVGGSIIMPALLTQMLQAAEVDPLAPKRPMFKARAKRVIFLYMSGGVSHVDSFDPKPQLIKDQGKTIYRNQYAKRPDWAFRRYGKCGMEISDLFPHVGGVADDVCLIRSMHADHANHVEATLGVHTGSVNVVRPSIGSWVSYGLGTENENLPSFVALAPYLPYAGTAAWGNDFLPPSHQGVRVIPGPEPIRDMSRRVASPALQNMELGLLAQMNRKHLASRDNDPQLAARIRSFETAAGMQHQAPETFDLSRESDETLAMYGLERGSTKGFGWQCLVARRLVERGVRFVELIDTGSSGNWDSHSNMIDHAALAKNVDQPIGALIKDLKQRGMLDETLVVWTTEFGRTPFALSATHKGREHHRYCFSSWMAGGGVKGGTTYGASDEYGITPAVNGVHTHDFHATILALLGLDHEKLTYRHGGRDYRLTDVSGRVITDVMA